MFDLSSKSRITLFVFAFVAFAGPNALYLYYSFTQPELLQAANANPIALAFMIEAMMLLGLFLAYVWVKTKSWAKVGLYLVLSFIGSLAFSFPFFLFMHAQRPEQVTPNINDASRLDIV